MLVALISDIHGNSLALDAVLSDLESERVDQIVCLGDVSAFGPQPVECIELLREIDCPVVMGNTDEQLLHSLTQEEATDERTRRLLDLFLWCSEHLSENDLDYIRHFRQTVSLTLGDGEELLCFHGSPRSFNDVIVASTPDVELDSMLRGHNVSFMAGGHTHRQFVRRYGNSVVMNPGSIGLDTPFVAEYALLKVEDGRSRVELRSLPLSRDSLIKITTQAEMPHAEWWLNPENG